jgi:excinuclease ABC subunit A
LIGKEGGENGGKLLAVGTPEKKKDSVTGKYLKDKL